MKYIRLKDSKDEHDDEEEDVGSQDRHLIDALLSFFINVNHIYGKGREMIKTWTKNKDQYPETATTSSVILISYLDYNSQR